VTAGQTLGGYRLLRVLGEGGMGVVHLALDPADRAVAVKVVRPGIAADPETRARLAREVRSLLRVRHPRVAEVLDADFDAELPYVVMRYVPGEALDAVVRRDGPLSGPLLAELAVGLFEAVAAVHAVGVVHRDLKPGNVLLMDGSPVVIDFGIARSLDDVALTSTGLMVGTPGYLSPEVLDGTDVGPAADWWGWGAVVAYAATGRTPFRGGPLEAVWDRVRRGAADLDGVDEPWARLLAATLRADPAARPSPEQLAGQIAALTGRRPELPTAAASLATTTTRVQTRSPAAAPSRSDVGPGIPRAEVRPRPGAEAPATRVVRRPPPATPAAQPGHPSQPTRPVRVQPAPAATPGPVTTTARLPVVQPAPPVQPGQRGQAAQQDRSGGTWPVAGAALSSVPSGPGPVEARGPVQPRLLGAGAPVTRLPRRPLMTVLGLLVVAAVAAVTPPGGAVLVLLWAGFARSVQWSRVSAAMSRARSGRLGAGARTGLTLMYPFRLVGALLASAGFLVLGALVVSPLLLVGAAVLLRDVPWDSWTTVQAVLLQPAVLSVLVVVAAVLAWFGPGGRALRQGSRALTEPVVRSRNGRLVLTGLTGLVVVAAVLVLVSGGA